jgi:hypothetical protein
MSTPTVRLGALELVTWELSRRICECRPHVPFDERAGTAFAKLDQQTELPF